MAGAADRQILFGAYPRERGGETEPDGVLRVEEQIDRPLAFVREFVNWNETFPDGLHTWLKNHGTAIYLSVKSKRGSTDIPWRSIADAPVGSQLHSEIVGWANKIKNYGSHVFFTFNHEPEAKASDGMGDAPDFIAAWRRIVKVFRNKGVTNAEFIWTMTDYAFTLGPEDPRGRYAPRWYPGDKWVDGIAADVYNWFTCRQRTSGISNPWWPMAHVARGVRDFAALHPTEKLFLAEWASFYKNNSPTDTSKADWIAEAQALFKTPAWSQLAGISYFNTQDGRDPDCKWWIDDPNPSALQAFVTMAQDPFYGAPSPA